VIENNATAEDFWINEKDQAL